MKLILYEDETKTPWEQKQHLKNKWVKQGLKIRELKEITVKLSSVLLVLVHLQLTQRWTNNIKSYEITWINLLHYFRKIYEGFSSIC